MIARYKVVGFAYKNRPPLETMKWRMNEWNDERGGCIKIRSMNIQKSACQISDATSGGQERHVISYSDVIAAAGALLLPRRWYHSRAAGSDAILDGHAPNTCHPIFSTTFLSMKIKRRKELCWFFFYRCAGFLGRSRVTNSSWGGLNGGSCSRWFRGNKGEIFAQ